MQGVSNGLGSNLAATKWKCACALRGSIDTHHHIYPPKFTRENIDRIVSDIGVAPPAFYLNWSPQSAIDKMDEACVATAINSMSSPGVWYGPQDAGRTRARECNEYGARLMQDFPGRFGMFGVIPLPDIEGSLSEIAHTYDVLKLDGVGLLTSYEGKLLGDPAFAPVYEELGRRKATVFVHPTGGCSGPIPGVAPPIIDFPFESTRTIVSLLFGGVFARYPDIRFIFSHGGGALLPIANRLEYVVARLTPEQRLAKAPNGAQLEIQRQFYDLASIGMNAAGMAGLRGLIPPTQLLYGSDEPFTSTVQTHIALCSAGLPADDWLRMRRGNAEQLFPRLSSFESASL